jgi:chloramphenicol-sensitive protein RarD
MATLLPVILALKWWRRVQKILIDRTALAYMLASTVFLSLNWVIFIWAIANNFVLQSSLGYYINTLVSVLLGVVVLGEKLRTMQWIAVAVACSGVVVMVVMVGEVPWIAISLGLSFGVYGLLRKKSPAEALPGLFVETALVVPLSLGYIGWLWFGPGMVSPVVRFDDVPLLLLVISSGVVTSVPLVFFVAATRRLPLSMVGFFQYVTPTGHFVLAVYVFNEPFTNGHLASFALIWLALGLYTSDLMRRARQSRREQK